MCTKLTCLPSSHVYQAHKFTKLQVGHSAVCPCSVPHLQQQWSYYCGTVRPRRTFEQRHQWEWNSTDHWRISCSLRHSSWPPALLSKRTTTKKNYTNLSKRTTTKKNYTNKYGAARTFAAVVGVPNTKASLSLWRGRFPCPPCRADRKRDEDGLFDAKMAWSPNTMGRVMVELLRVLVELFRPRALKPRGTQ